MGVTIPADLEPVVDEMVATGVYPSREAVIRAAIERMRDDQGYFQELRKSFDEALAEFERGEYKQVDFADIRRQVRDQFAARQS